MDMAPSLAHTFALPQAVRPRMANTGEIASMHRQNGFTLMELMIVVAIVGIIAGLAYPSYLKSMQKGRRVDGKTALVQASQALERCYSTYGLYNSANCAEYNAITAGTVVTQQGYYTITAPTLNGTAYTLQAAAKSTGPQASDTTCTPLTLSNTGAQGPSGCW
jgi:type IV pilus assembly protein PilE